VNYPASHLRYLLPVVLSGMLSFALCAVMAVFLFREQSSSAAALGENIVSHRAAAALEESLEALVNVLDTRPEGVPALNDRAAEHITLARGYVDQPREGELVDQIEHGFARYLDAWHDVPIEAGSDRTMRIRTAVDLLRMEVLRACQLLREYNAQRIIDSEAEHRATLRKLAWGLAAIGGSAGLAGLFLGFGVARGLTRSIQRIQVRVQDAAGLLDRDLVAVDLIEGGTLDQLDRQVQALVGRIEGVVQTLQQREREVRRAEQLAAIGQLAAGMAHELRNPLTSIKMLVQAGRDGGLSPDDLEVVEREVRRVERSLQTFLDFARPPRPSKAPTDLNTVVAETLELIRTRAAQQSVTIWFEAVSVTVDADGDQIRQVLLNLLLNALDAMPGGGAITVAVRTELSAAVIQVTDNGPGIAASIRPRLFEPFASTKDTGLGLGLSICRRIVEDHGGSIDVASPVAGGTTFIVRLPVVQVATLANDGPPGGV
jgi:two-component system, NtrC family, sensor histidine kinase HydH